MVTRPDQERIRQAIRTDAGVSDTGLIPDYYRLLPDGRLLWGGRAAAREWPIPKIKQRLLRGMTRLYPQLADIPVDMAWSGLMPFARHQMPVITCISDGLWIASGFGGHGLAATTLAGTLIAAAIAEGDDRYRLFAPFGMPFAGGPLLGRAAVQLVVWHQRVKEHVGRAVFQSGARHGASNQTQE